MNVHRDMESVSTKQSRIANTARKYPDEALTVLHPYLDLHWLWESSQRVNKTSACGIDGLGWQDYEDGKQARLASLLERAQAGHYRAPPVRRVYIPKGNGEERGIGIPTLEDKILQRSIVMLLEPIYEEEFKGFSFGFRPGRSPHQALEYLRESCFKHQVGYILDVDLRQYFDNINHQQLKRILRERVGDSVVLRLVHKWLHAGVWECGQVHYPEQGSPQGGVISPLLSNVYLHSVLDKWFEETMQAQLLGRSFMVRFADDFVMGFEDKRDALHMLDALQERFAQYGLNIHPDKSRLVRFRRPSRYSKSLGDKAESFDFLGFTHYWGESRKGNNVIKRKTSSKRFAGALKRIKEWCRLNRHKPLRVQQWYLNTQLRGHYQYYGIPGNSASLSRFLYEVTHLWRRWLGQRNRDGMKNWRAFNDLLKSYPLEKPFIALRSTPSETMI